MSYGIVQGDLEPDMPLTVTAAGALAALPTALSVQLRWKKPDGTVSTVALTVVDAPTGAVKRTWVAGDTDLVGWHEGQIVVTAADGNDLSSPVDGTYLLWNVFAKIA